MACELVLFVYGLMGVHSVCSLSEINAYPSPTLPVFSCRKLKCPPGYSTLCSQSGVSRCVPCVEGTFTENHSRRRECRPCARCRDDQFELQPCTPTSNVICKECSQCGQGYGVLKPCERTRDTVCEKCPPVAKGGLISYSNIECNSGGSEDPDFIYGKGREKEKPKESMTIIEVEKTWPDVKKEPKHHQKLTVDEKHEKATFSSRGLPSVNPSPSSSFSTKTNGAATQRTFSSVSVASNSPLDLLDASSTSITLALGESISPSLTTPAIPTERHPPAKVQRTKATEKTEFPHINTEEPPRDGMQGDEPPVARHTRRNIQQNSTILLKPREASSVLPGTENMFDPLVPRGMAEPRHSTEFSPPFTLQTGIEVEHIGMPAPTNKNRSRSLTSRPWLWAVVAVAMTVAVLTIIGVNRCRRHFKQTEGCFFRCPRPKCRPPRCTGSSDCCDGASVSSVADVYTEQNSGKLPVRLTIENDDSLPNSNNTTLHTYLPSESTIVVADVHHKTVFDLFNIREQHDGITRSYPEYITQAKATFNSSGGKLCHLDSNVRIIVDSGAVPEGSNQDFFFRVVYDETSLLRDIPETPDRTLISPVIQCGPEDIVLLKPVEVVVPHCLYLDEVKKESITVYRCDHYSDEGPINWEKVPSASEKNCQSKAWFTVKKDSIHIKTKVFSFWSVFACGGPKKKRATIFSSRPNLKSDLVYLRFYIYSDNEDSKKRVEARERERFPDSKPTKEKPFKMYNDNIGITVKLTDLEEGWQLDKTDGIQTYTYETAYRNGFRSKDSCDFAVKPTSQGVNEFSCILRFQQEDRTPEHTIYINPGFTPRQTIRRFSVESTGSETPSNNNNNNSSATGAGSISVVPEETELECSEGQEDKPSPVSLANETEASRFSSLGSENEPVTVQHCRCIHQHVGGKWNDVLRNLSIEEVTIESLDADYSKVAEKLYQGLLAWTRSRGTQRATTKKLCDALRLVGCSEALERLSSQGVTSDAPAPVSDSTAGLGTCL